MNIDTVREQGFNMLSLEHYTLFKSWVKMIIVNCCGHFLGYQNIV